MASRTPSSRMGVSRVRGLLAEVYMRLRSNFLAELSAKSPFPSDFVLIANHLLGTLTYSDVLLF